MTRFRNFRLHHASGTRGPVRKDASKFGDSQYGRRKSGGGARGRYVHKQARLREVARAVSWAHVKCVARKRVYHRLVKCAEYSIN